MIETFPIPLPERSAGQPMRHRHDGFTLIELLMVIGIIALLIAILVPTLGVARESAKRTQCLSNLRQMVVAANIYVNENGGYYPLAQYSATHGSTLYRYCWDMTSVTQTGQPTKVVPGLLWNGKGATAIQQCPSFDGRSNWGNDPHTGYNYNTSYIGRGEGEQDPRRPTLDIVPSLKAVNVRRPGRVALFGDGQFGGGANKFMRAPFDSEGEDFTGRTGGTQGFRHRKLTNVAFCDGHAESLRDRFTATDDYGATVAAGTGFLSPDNTLYGGN